MAETATDDETARTTVVCTDGTRVGCTNFKAIESGVLLTEDLKKNRVMGFVPHDEVRFVLPTSKVERELGAQSDGERNFDNPLMRLPGLGSTYAKRLQSAGFDTFEDVANASPSALQEETGAREAVTREWVEQAREFAADDGGHADTDRDSE